MHHKVIKTLLLVTFFSISMGFLESAVVIYLREIYYPKGFNFPMQMISNTVALTEFIREIATIIMLLTISIIAGRNKIEKFAYFLFSFAIWDIFYYVFLKLIIAWPQSIFTWDVLFLIPTTWVGPVIAPVINSFTMLFFSFCIVYFTEIKGIAKINALQWLLLIIGSLIVIVAYTEEYIGFMYQFFNISDLLRFSPNKQIIEKTYEFVPQHFQWFLFFLGIAFHFVAIFLFCLNNKKTNNTIFFKFFYNIKF